jgi:hypothetical protein
MVVVYVFTKANIKQQGNPKAASFFNLSFKLYYLKYYPPLSKLKSIGFLAWLRKKDIFSNEKSVIRCNCSIKPI